MAVKDFFIWLSGVTAGTALLLAIFFILLPDARIHTGFSLAVILLFALICTGLFYAGRSTAGSSSKLAFTNLVSASVFGKMLLAVAALFIYQQSIQPANQWFVGIFLLVYVVYTVFEVWFMTRLAKT